MNFIISKAVKENIQEIETIYEAARQFMADHGNGGQWGKKYPSEEDIIKDINDNILYVCRPENTSEIAAVFAYYIGEDPNYSFIENGNWPNNSPYGVIHRIAAAPSARGMGAPSACIDYCFRDCGNLRIDTHELNKPMRSLIEKSGFKYCGIVTMQSDNTKRLAYQKTAKLILASKSPRRAELMSKLGCPFFTDPAMGDEKVPNNIKTEDTSLYLARLKAAEVFDRHREENCIIIGSDTVVICDNVIFGKPKDKDDAFKMLKKLSGKTHEVYTGVVIKTADNEIAFSEKAEVSFYEMSDDEIKTYIESGEPMDKAGAYGIQGLGALFIKKINGDFYTVMGLPIAELYHRLKEYKIEEEVDKIC